MAQRGFRSMTSRIREYVHFFADFYDMVTVLWGTKNRTYCQRERADKAGSKYFGQRGGIWDGMADSFYIMMKYRVA